MPYLLAWDAESFLVQPGLPAPQMVCASFVIEGFDPWVLPHEEACHELAARLEDPACILAAHNGPFDFAVACAHRPDLIPLVFAAYRDGRVRDTLTRQELLDIAAGLGVEVKDDGQERNAVVYRERAGKLIKSGRSLADLAFWHLGKDRYASKKNPDSPRLRFREVFGKPVKDWPAGFAEYSLEDSVDALDVLKAQAKEAGIDPLERMVDELEQLRSAWCLHLISTWGLRTDEAGVDKLEQEVTVKYQELRKQFIEAGFYHPKRCAKDEPPEFFDEKVRPMRWAKNTEAIKSRVVQAFAARGEEAPRKPITDKMREKGVTEGNISTDADTLGMSGDPLLAELGSGGPINTIKNTFLPTLKRGTKVPINTFYRNLLATGRISSADPNMNNIPRSGGVRECIVPRPGFVFCSVDYDCAELRSHAQICKWLFGRSDAADFFNAEPNGDPHLELAASILGITSEEAKKRKKAGDPEIKATRQMCKSINFGLPGGMGAKKLKDSARRGYNVHMTEAEAALRKKQWKGRWREMDLYFKYIDRVVNTHGVIQQMRPPGRGTPHRLRGNVGYSDGSNTLFQGLTADGAKHAMWKVMWECYVDEASPLFGSRVVVFLYDELITEVPEDVAHEAAHRQAEVMRDAMREWLPDVPVTCSPALMRRWTKAAEPVYINDRLVPWEDRKAA